MLKFSSASNFQVGILTVHNNFSIVADNLLGSIIQLFAKRR